MHNQERKDKKIKIFYHVTKKEYVKNILKSSLMPGRDVRKQNIYHGICGDPAYIYLFNEEVAGETSQEVINGEHGAFKSSIHTLLKVIISLSHPVEKDYDQLLYILNNSETKDWRNLWVKPFLKRLGVEFKGHLSRKNLIYHIDLVPDEIWDQKIGSYRTPTPIHGKNIKNIGFEYFVKKNPRT